MASMPSAAALRKAAPTLVWSTTSSSTTTVRAGSSTSDTVGSGSRCSEARAPRCTWKPVTCSASSSLTTKHGASVVASTSERPSSQRGAIRNERTGNPACDGSPHDLLPLGQEQPVLGLEMGAQLHVTQVAVVGQHRITRVVDLDQLRHAFRPFR